MPALALQANPARACTSAEGGHFQRTTRADLRGGENERTGFQAKTCERRLGGGARRSLHAGSVAPLLQLRPPTQPA